MFVLIFRGNRYFKEKVKEEMPDRELADYDELLNPTIPGFKLSDIFPAEEDENTGRPKLYNIDDIIEALPKN